ncbi:MAG: PocR ligand-binding domain-containing protein [Candidatus Omnitrophota bacterium]
MQNNPKPRKSVPALKDLINVEAWQDIQDNFSLVTGIDIRLIDSKGNPLIRRSNHSSALCSDYSPIAQTVKEKVCVDCLPTFLGGNGVVDRNLSFSCIPGLDNFIVPLSIENEVLGYILMGPVILVMRKTKEQYSQIAESLNVDLEELWSAILELKVISFHGAQSMLELVKDVGEYIVNLAYRDYMKEEGVSFKLSTVKLHKILELLLDVAFEITGADIGSVMLVDKKSDELSIKASRGISDDIVARTRVKLGSRISGLAAREGEAFLIDKALKDNRISRYLERPSLNSSMVVPLKLKDTVVGVMNLAILSTSPNKFSQDGLELMRKLADLATVAIPT